MHVNRQGEIVEDASCLSHGHARTRVDLLTISDQVQAGSRCLPDV